MVSVFQPLRLQIRVAAKRGDIHGVAKTIVNSMANEFIDQNLEYRWEAPA